MAREAAAAFSERLLAARDFGPVVKEMFAADFMRRHLALQSSIRKEAGNSSFMLHAVPALEFNTGLLSRPEDENWPRLYAAVSSLLFYTYLSLMARGSLKDLSDPEKMRGRDLLSVYPGEAVKVLEKNRTTANFLRRRGRGAEVATADDLRAAAETLEEAARLTRARLDGVLSARGSQLAQNLERLRPASERSEVELVPEGGPAPVLYPPGTRVFKLFSPLLYDVYLVSEGGRMKIAWANLPME
jgi:hypothetical protein